LSKGGATIVSIGFRLQRTRPSIWSRTAGGRQSYGFNSPLADLGEIAHIESLAGTWAFLKMIGLTLSDAISIGAADLFTARNISKAKSRRHSRAAAGPGFENRLFMNTPGEQS
jgi:hypothetical protein